MDRSQNVFVSGILPEFSYRFVLGRNTPVAHEAGRRLSASPQVTALLGEAMLGAFFIESHTTKDPSLKSSLHLECDGPVKRVIAFGANDGGLRAHVAAPEAAWDGPVSAGKHAGLLKVSRWFSDGQIYTSNVEMRDVPLDKNIEEYLARSDQILTFLRLESSLSGDVLDQVSGYMFQALPDATYTDADRLLDWLGGVSAGELLDFLSGDENSPRMDHVIRSTSVRVLGAGQFRFRCDCDMDRVRSALLGLGRQSVESLVEEEGRIEVFCEFCRRRFELRPEDVNALFGADSA